MINNQNTFGVAVEPALVLQVDGLELVVFLRGLVVEEAVRVLYPGGQGYFNAELILGLLWKFGGFVRRSTVHLS